MRELRGIWYRGKNSIGIITHPEPDEG